ncbi:MAG: hypothetical protein LAN71_01790 [Acidobacteriia bacterium]|nr:hypothetical protein [Terriglobia bacterium]
MTWTVISFVVLVGLLLAILSWSLRESAEDSPARMKLVPGTGSPLHNALYYPQVRQTFSEEDLNYLQERGSPKLARRARAERQRVALEYVKAIHHDFRSLLQIARVLATLSPKVVAGQEAERFRLAVEFELRYRCVRLMLLAGISPQWQLLKIVQTVGTLSTRLDAAILEMGERAVQALQETAGTA